MGIFDFFNKKKKYKELLLQQQEQERVEHEKFVRQQKLNAEKRAKEREEWLAENHKKATERNARLSALRERMKEATKEIDEENEKRRIEIEKKMQEEQDRQERDRQRRIEESRRKRAQQQATQKVSVDYNNVPKNIQDIIDVATIGLVAAQKGNYQLEQQSLFNLFNLTQAKASQLLHIPADKYNLLGSGFCLLLEYQQVKANETISRAIADYAFFCISKAIDIDPTNKTLYLKRISIIAQTRRFFFYTVANALEIPDSNPFDFLLSAPLIVRTNDYIYAMGKYDFENGDKIVFEGVLKEFHDLCYGPYVGKTAADGKDYIDKVNEYIANSISRW